jgi:nucleoside-diphosphate-sugar epimerase
MTVLLTGGSGFLGSHIAEQLSSAGRPFRVLVRRTSATSHLRQLKYCELVEGAIDDRASLQQAASGVTHIIHAAGLVKAKSAADFHRVNAAGTQNIVDAALKAAPELKRLVLVSSLSVTGPSLDGTPVTTEQAPSPVTNYGRSKLAGERAALAAAQRLPLTILRPPLIYGPRDREVLAFFQSVKYRVFPYMGSTARGVSVIYGPDAASACIAALDAEVPSGRAFYLEDGKTRTLAELIGEIERALGRRALLRFPIPRRALELAALGTELYGKLSQEAVMLTRDKVNELYAPHWVCDATDTRHALSWRPEVPFERGAQLTAEWYKREGWL